MTKKIVTIAALILVVALAAGGGFYGGMQYQSNQASQAEAAFFEGRGGMPGGQMPGEGQAPADGQMPGGQGGFMGGRGVTGEVKTNNGQTLTISTAEDVTTVQISADTLIQMTVEGASEDLQPGTRVRITGETANDGVITASQIVVVDETAAPPVEP